MKNFLVFFFLFLSKISGAQNFLFFPNDSRWIDLGNKNKQQISFVPFVDVEFVMIDNVYCYLSVIDTRRTDLYKFLGDFTSLANIQTDASTGFRFFINSAKCFSSSKPFRTYVLSGGDIFLVAHQPFNVKGEPTFVGAVSDFTAKATMEEGLRQRRSTLYDRPLNYQYLDGGIARITASSFLTETVGGKPLEYRPQYMMDRICKAAEGWEFEPEFDNFMRCWSEGVPGAGIGEWLRIDFARPSDEILILNGYVDFGNMASYKRNNRLKKVKIESDSPRFSIEYLFEDFVAYHSVKLPVATSSVKLTILDVFKGDRYDDTCVTAIALPQERWRSKAAEEKEVRAYLDKLGVLDHVKRFQKSSNSN